MQAVILAAGLGKRMGTLTDSTPKVLLEVAGKTLLEHKLGILPMDIDEVILVVGHLGEMVRRHIGSQFNGRTIRYVEQPAPLGTADALWRAKHMLSGKFS